MKSVILINSSHNSIKSNHEYLTYYQSFCPMTYNNNKNVYLKTILRIGFGFYDLFVHHIGSTIVTHRSI